MSEELKPCPRCGATRGLYVLYEFPVVMHYRGLDIYFDSASDVENRTGIPAQSVQKCCTGKMKTSHGAVFEYVSRS